MIKFFESTDAGAPTLNNAVGSMIAVLDACLITGYNNKAVTSITVASGVATVVCTAHGYANTYGKVIRIAGATPAGLNKDTQIANVSTNGFTFLCPGVADGAATGTLTAKYAPLDWVKQYSGTNKAMYKRGDVTATACMLRIDDNVVGQSCRALMVQSATDVDTYTNPAPVAAQIADGLGQHWSKGYGFGGSVVPWYVVGDEKYFYLFVRSGVSTTASLGHGFGDIIDFKPGSVLGCVLSGMTDVSGNAYAYHGGTIVSGCHIIAGGKNGITNSQPLIIETRLARYGNAGVSYPSDVDGGLVIQHPIMLKEGESLDSHVRGVLPGWGIPLANLGNAMPQKTLISNIIGNPRCFLVAHCATGALESASSIGLIDLTGPWR